LKKLGTPEDISNLMYFLSSEEASWITGEVVTIDGGYLL
jgi:3-oxoacyl-[acyl-carrier protein] reductase